MEYKDKIKLVKYLGTAALCFMLLAILIYSATARIYDSDTDKSLTQNLGYTWSDIVVNGSDYTDPIEQSLNFTIYNSTRSSVYSNMTVSNADGFHYTTFTLSIEDTYYWMLRLDSEIIAGDTFEIEESGDSAICDVWSDSVCPQRDVTGSLT